RQEVLHGAVGPPAHEAGAATLVGPQLEPPEVATIGPEATEADGRLDDAGGGDRGRPGAVGEDVGHGSRIADLTMDLGTVPVVDAVGHLPMADPEAEHAPDRQRPA